MILMNKQKHNSVVDTLLSSVIAEFTAESLGEFCNVIDIVSETWRTKVAERQIRNERTAHFYPGELSPWFRGVSQATYKCESTLFRFYEKSVNFEEIKQPKIRDIELYFLQRFKTFGAPFLDKLPNNDIEWHFLMRHHDVPSRLLDWSKGSFIALYFATRKSLKNIEPSLCNIKSDETYSDAAVWMLEPRRLSEECHGTRSIYGTNRDKHMEEINKYFSEVVEEIPAYPLPLIPNIVAPRIKSHMGRFTLHSFDKYDLERFAKKGFEDDNISYLVKIKIPYKNHLSIYRSLRSAGVSDMNFTQDLDGLADELSLRINLGREDHNRLVRQLISEREE